MLMKATEAADSDGLAWPSDPACQSVPRRILRQGDLCPSLWIEATRLRRGSETSPLQRVGFHPGVRLPTSNSPPLETGHSP